MAGLLAAGLLLGLFWLLSPLFGFLGDKAENFELSRETRAKAIKGNVYTIAWARFEELQKECLEANPDQKDNLCIVTWYNFRHDVSMEEEAIIYAINDLRSRKQMTFKTKIGNPYDITYVAAYDKFDVAKHAKDIERAMPPLYGRFQIPFACKVSDAKAQEIFKSIWNKKRSADNRVIPEHIKKINPLDRTPLF